MPSAKVTSKGQITLPKEIRKALGLRQGARVTFQIRTDGRALMEPETVDLLSLRGSIRPRVRSVSIETMNEAIRQAGSRK